MNAQREFIIIATITDESLGTQAFWGLSSNLISPTPPRTPQTSLDACIQNFSRVSTLYRLGRENCKTFPTRLHCFVRASRNNKLKKIMNNASMCQGNLSAIVGIHGKRHWLHVFGSYYTAYPLMMDILLTYDPLLRMYDMLCFLDKKKKYD